jgi:hypothetical protein
MPTMLLAALCLTGYSIRKGAAVLPPFIINIRSEHEG